QLYRRAILIAIGGNILLAAAKGFIAWLSGSSAIFSDAANSLSDSLYSLFMGIGLYLSQRPADETHPQGHSRFEPLVSLFIAIAMAAAGVTAIANGIDRFFGGSPALQTFWPTLVLLGAMAVKFGMYRAVKRIGEDAESPAIRASATDNLVDILATAAALIGVLGSRWFHPLFDPVAGILVGNWIFKSTWDILHENLGYLTGRGAPDELIEKIVMTASDVPGVRNVHRVVADYVGPQIRVDMHINVDGNLPLHEAHSISEEVQKKVRNVPDVELVFVHVEPASPGNKPD
ncbi:MAG: cation diffusion facilitator family transporter, partial [Candidatus Marinimicrobia bacterium]|nr:cation diffusion facilitator family transporter [Candidatus Neomarinimicrobiota bacterium]